MSRLLDDLRGGSMAMPRFIPPQFAIRWERHGRPLAQLLREDLPVILIDNVAEYFYETSDQEHWDIRDHFPNIAPPYGIWWMEHRVPRKIHSAKCGDTDVAALIPGGRVGFLFIGAPVADVKSEKLPANARWILAIEVFIDYGPALDNEIQGPHGTIT